MKLEAAGRAFGALFGETHDTINPWECCSPPDVHLSAWWGTHPRSSRRQKTVDLSRRLVSMLKVVVMAGRVEETLAFEAASR